MDVTVNQLNDLVRWLGQRETSRRLAKEHRTVWGWLAREHAIRPVNQALIQALWRQVEPIAQAAGEDQGTIALELASPRPTGTGRILRVLPRRRPRDVREVDDVAFVGPTSIDGFFVPLEDYGVRHAAGALARTRPKAPRS